MNPYAAAAALVAALTIAFYQHAHPGKANAANPQAQDEQKEGGGAASLPLDQFGISSYPGYSGSNAFDAGVAGDDFAPAPPPGSDSSGSGWPLPIPPTQYKDYWRSQHGTANAESFANASRFLPPEPPQNLPRSESGRGIPV